MSIKTRLTKLEAELKPKEDRIIWELTQCLNGKGTPPTLIIIARESDKYKLKRRK